MSKKIALTLALLVSVFFVWCQPFASEIAAFKKQDSIQPPAKNSILFAGSSSFRMWNDIQQYFPGYSIINRGFGGSTLMDMIHYENDILFPYHPRQIVIYCGENDLAASDTVTGQIVFQRSKILFQDIRNKFRGIPIAFVSIKPSPSRQHLIPKMEDANKLIKKFLRNKKNTSFIDVYHKMLKEDGSPIDDIFLSDKLHMNAKGYAIWGKIITPYLVKE